MDKRYSLRLPTDIHITFYAGHKEYSGVIANISRNGMCIKSRNACPAESELEVIIPAYNETLKVPARVNWPEVKSNQHSMGLEIPNAPGEYIRFIESLFFYYTYV